MKLLALEIEGYGVWSGLKLQRMSDGLNVVYGPNEAGKSTLLHFIRSALYGFSSDRHRYLPPLHGSRPGGWLEVSGAGGQFQIARYPSADGNPRLDETLITAADGIRQSEQVVKTLLASIDEATFNNVFAVSLSEMQELATLSDTQAADVLYNITAGLDRVSLVDVTRELETTRNHILDQHGGPSQIVQLMNQREQIRRQIEEQQLHSHAYARLAGDRETLQRELSRLEGEKEELRQQLDLRDLAAAVRDRWHRHRALGEELSAVDPQIAVPADSLERLEVIQQRTKKNQAGMERLHRHRQALRREAEELNVNEALGRHGGRITATLEQEPWLRALEGQIAELEKQRQDLNATMFAEYEKMGLGKPAKPDRLPHFSPQALTRLRNPGRHVAECLKKCKALQREAEDAQQTAANVHEQVTAALSKRQATDLTTATEQAGNLVNQLRRRMQLDERLEQMTRNEKELQEQAQALLEKQVPAVNTALLLGLIFVVGVLILSLGLLVFPSWVGTTFWSTAIAGLVIAVAAVVARLAMQRSNDHLLEEGQEQLRLLQMQIKQTKDERVVLDDQLPRGGGAMASRLAAAERELAALEDLAPLDSRHAAARQDADGTACRAAQAEEDLRAARLAWHEGLEEAGLPENFSPRNVRLVARLAGRIRDMQSRLSLLDEELGQRRRERDMLHSRVAQLVADCGVEVQSQHPMEKVLELSEMLTRQEARIARRDVIRRRLRKLRRARAKGEESIARLHQRRKQLLRQCGAESEEHLHRLVAEATRVENLRREHEQIENDLAATIGTRASQADLRQHLEGPAAAHLDASRDDLRARLAGIEREIHQRIEKRGQLTAQMKSLVDDRQLAARQLDLAALQQRIDEAIGRWQVLAVTGQILESIRASYETDRQPETLQEASGYFSQMTQGRYHRVWTPVGERVLRVEDHQGHWLPVEVLSRGAREQLFLSLRLSLAAYFARRGAPLPLILDDVLVNFDSERAKAAAQVLRDFAAQGHQMLIFTCHEHIAKLFRSLKAPVNELPDNSERNPAPLIFEEGPKERPKKPVRPALAARKAAKSRLAETEDTSVEAAEISAVEPPSVDAPPWEEAPEPRFEETLEAVGEVWEEE
ncbi:MAG: AAA family ATPase [Thermoguttaceae bacterium]